jgi:hypothetical protein
MLSLAGNRVTAMGGFRLPPICKQGLPSPEMYTALIGSYVTEFLDSLQVPFSRFRQVSLIVENGTDRPPVNGGN